MDLFGRTLGVTGLFQIINQFLKIIKIVLIGYALNKNELGIVAIIGLFLFILESFSKTGTTDYLIAKKGKISEEEYNNAWTIDVIKNLILFVITIISSHAICSFYSIEEEKFLYVCSVIFIFNALRNNRIVDFQKNLEMKKYWTYNTIPNVVSVLVLFVMYKSGFSIYAVLVAMISQSTTLCILSYIYKKNSVKIYLNRRITKEQINFGVWIFLQNIIDVLNEKFDKIIYGKLFGKAWLGDYQFAASLTSDVQFQLRGLCRISMFPYFCKVDDQLLIKKKYNKFLNIYSLLGVLGILLVVTIYPKLNYFLFENKWKETNIIIFYLAILSYTGGLIITTESIFLEQKKPKEFYKINLIKTVISIITIIFFALKYSYDGVIMALVVISIINCFIFYVIVMNENLLNRKGLVGQILLLIFLIAINVYYIKIK